MLSFFGLIILSAAIIMCFLDEFSRIFKSIFSIPGMKLLLPLFAASWLIEVGDKWILWVLLRIWTLLHHFLTHLSFLFFNTRGSLLLIQIIFLVLLGAIPIWIQQWKIHTEGYRYLKMRTDYIEFMIWTVFAILIAFP